MIRMRAQIAVTISVISITLMIPAAKAQDWPQWRGPNRNGGVASFSAPVVWPKNLTRKWKTEVGGGYSSPIVQESRVYLHTRRGEEEIVSCIDLSTGKIIWNKNYNAAFNKNQYAVKMGKGPNSTPVLHAGKLYTLGVTAILSCFDSKTGALKWRKDFSKDIDTSKLFCGTAMSPVMDRGLLIVHLGDDRRGWVIAFDQETGNEKWKWEGDGPGYASPIIADSEGARQFITLTDKSVIGIAVDTGRLLWKLPFPDEWNENIVTPVAHGNNLIISSVRQGTRAIRISKERDQWKAVEVWRNPKLAMYMSSPVLDGDFVYGLSHFRKGQFFCLDARTGETMWTTDGREGANASLLDAKNVLFMLTSDGDLIVANKSAKAFEQVARYTVADSSTWAHPVVLGRQILVKDESNLTLWVIE